MSPVAASATPRYDVCTIEYTAASGSDPARFEGALALADFRKRIGPPVGGRRGLAFGQRRPKGFALGRLGTDRTRNRLAQDAFARCIADQTFDPRLEALDGAAERIQ